MAKCRECGIEIPEGAEYCENCLSKLNTVKDSESYLDSLLNAVMTEEPERREVFSRKRKEKSSPVSAPQKEADLPEQTKEEEPVEADIPEEDEEEAFVEADIPEDVEEKAFVEADIPEDAEEEAFAEAGTSEDAEEEAFVEADIPEDDEEGFVKPDAPKNVKREEEELMGNSAPEKAKREEGKLPDLKNYSIFQEIDETDILHMFDADLNLQEELESPQGEPETSGTSEFGDFAGLFAGGEEAEPATFQEEPESPQEEPETPDASEFGDFAGLFAGGEEAEPATLQEGSESPQEEPETLDSSEFGDFADLFAGGEEAEPVTLQEGSESPQEEPETLDSSEFSDFADLFAGGEGNGMEFQSGIGEAESMEKESMADPGLDTLFSGLDEMQGEMSAAEDDGSGNIPGENGLEPDLEKFLAGFSEEELNGSGTEREEKKERLQPAGTAAGETPETGKKKKDRGGKKKKEKGEGRISALYHRLFDNVKVDPSKIKPQPTKEEIEAKKKAAQEAKERSKEEKEAQLAEKKEQERLAKAEKQRLAREAKAEKKAKKLKEAKLLLEEMEATRINRAGASIVFIFFAMIAVVILFGTDIFSYQLSIRNASAEFERDEYTLAYNEIFGLDIQEEDIILYDRIMTVMYVQKQLNSYYNYYEMKDYPKALDSLLKGLQRYEKYIGLAIELDVDSDLDSVRSKILTEIDVSFSMSEQEAMAIMQSDSQLEYSIRVYDAAERAE